MLTRISGYCLECRNRVSYTIPDGCTTIFPREHNTFARTVKCEGRLRWEQVEPAQDPTTGEDVFSNRGHLQQIERELRAEDAIPTRSATQALTSNLQSLEKRFSAWVDFSGPRMEKLTGQQNSTDKRLDMLSELLKRLEKQVWGRDNKTEPAPLHGSRAEMLVMDDLLEEHIKRTNDVMFRVLAERNKQKLKWDLQHDDTHEYAELARAAVCIALGDNKIYDFGGNSIWPGGWDFPERDKVERLVVACALLIAEIERIERYQNDPPA